MTDTLSKEHRSWLMSRVRSSNTKPELIVRSLLHKLGYRFRLHPRTLPGTPDVALKRYKTAVYVNGCFWHGHKNCKRSRLPKSNSEYWQLKILRNKQRDFKNKKLLKALGWKPLTVWECETTNLGKLEAKLRKHLMPKPKY